MSLLLGYGSYPAVLYVWAGQNASVTNAADFVAVVDFTEESPTYGQILKVVSLVSDPSNKIGQTNNEPHHSGISSDGNYYVTGGLLSFLAKQKEIFVWKIPQNPADGPKFACGIDAPGACTDEFLAIGGTQFIVSMMCNENAGSPGDMVVIDAKTCSARSLLKNASAIQNFNPHGFSRLDNGSLFVADYILPITLTGADASTIVFRNTARHIFPNGDLKHTFEFDFPTEPGATTGLGHGIGFMELKSIPKDQSGRSYACGTNTNTMYLIGPGIFQPLPVFDTSVVNNFIKRPSAGITSIFPDGKLLLETFQMRFVILLNITQPEQPTFLRVFDFCSDKAVRNMPIKVPESNETTTFPEFCAKNNNITGAHVIIHPQGERRFIVLNYFLKFGLAQFTGTRTVHAFKLNEDLTDFTYDEQFNPNFNFDTSSNKQRPTFHSLQAYPHHAQYLKLKNRV